MRKFWGIWFMIIWSLVVYCLVDPVVNMYNMDNIKFLSYIGIINFFVTFLIWKIAGGELFCAYTVFYLVMFVFCYGQSVGWLLELDMGSKDLYYRISTVTIVKSMIYSLISMIAIHFGAILSIREEKIRKTITETDLEAMNKAINKTGELFIWASLPFYVIDTLYTLYNVYTSGYAGSYNTLALVLGQVGTLIAMISNFFAPALICIFVANRKNVRMRRLAIVFLCIDVFKTLYVGGRSGAVMTLLVLFLVYHYCVNNFKFKQTVFISALAYLGMAVSNAVAIFRTEANKSLSLIFQTIGSSFANVFGDFFGELGWSMSSLMHTIEFVPMMEPFRWGKSYLYGLMAAIPNVGIWRVHPAKLYSNLGDWLQGMLDIDYGPGYTLIAEFYINFGWHGIIAAFVVGIIIGNLLGMLNQNTLKTNPMNAVVVFLVMLLLLKPIVRSSFSAVVRGLVYNVILYYVVMRFLYSRYRNQNIE